ncbi:hypothetical protein LUCX_116 [Xanthomonas phage vB_XciM_LucasX]|nr:hypothetical protein LUCX_116 [Xanthomonas phage vB_XciM_LucasX]
MSKLHKYGPTLLRIGLVGVAATGVVILANVAFSKMLGDSELAGEIVSDLLDVVTS